MSNALTHPPSYQNTRLYLSFREIQILNIGGKLSRQGQSNHEIVHRYYTSTADFSNILTYLRTIGLGGEIDRTGAV